MAMVFHVYPKELGRSIYKVTEIILGQFFILENNSLATLLNRRNGNAWKMEDVNQVSNGL